MSPSWSTATQERAFYVAFAVVLAALLWVLRPFFDAILFASATVVVTWPVFVRLRARVGDRPWLAAAGMLIGIVGLVLLPLGVLAFWSLQQAIGGAQELAARLSDGSVELRIREWTDALPRPAWLGDADPLELALVPLQELARTVAGGVAAALPGLVGSVVGGVLDGFVYALVVVALYLDGPAGLRVVVELSPIREDYLRRLFAVFREFASNAVVGSFATASVQGLVASVGYAIAGLEDLVLVSLLTGAFGFFPVVGTAVIWVPVALYVGATSGIGWGLFVVAWSLVLTGTVDNLVRPMFIRGRSPIHPVAVFLAVLGGFAWLGPAGSLVGPVVLAMFLAMVTILREDFASRPTPDDD